MGCKGAGPPHPPTPPCPPRPPHRRRRIPVWHRLARVLQCVYGLSDGGGAEGRRKPTRRVQRADPSAPEFQELLSAAPAAASAFPGQGGPPSTLPAAQCGPSAGRGTGTGARKGSTPEPWSAGWGRGGAGRQGQEGCGWRRRPGTRH